MQGIKYEITPFREESGYQDVRHPDDIRWTNSLLADARGEILESMRCIIVF